MTLDEILLFIYTSNNQIDDCHEAKQAIREAIERSGNGITMDVMGMGNVYQYRINILKELGLDETKDKSAD